MDHDSSIEEVEMQSAPMDVSAHFDGKKHRSFLRGVSYTNPRDVEEGDKTSHVFRHRDILGRVTVRPKDLLRYLDPADGKPRRLVVQSTPTVLNDGTGDWRRAPIKGDAPVILTLSSWALKTLLHRPKGQKYTPKEIAIIVVKVLAVVPLQTMLIMLPTGTNGPISPFYTTFPSRSWEYPLYAQNEFDAKPWTGKQTSWRNSVMVQSSSGFAREHARLLGPRLLVIKRGDGWSIERNVSDLPYLFISFTRLHFDPNPRSRRDCQALYMKAAELTIAAGLNAYWLDHLCIGQDEPETLSEDIHTICDVVRGARQLAVVLPDLTRKSLTDWGRRLWTLTEALLSSNDLIKFVSVDGQVMEKSRISLASDVWNNDQKARLLAEHFSGKLTLGRLELISIALQALDERKATFHFHGDLAYALAGLLGHRPVANPNDNLFQALARLSLANDSDRIVERMMCMLPQTPALPTGLRNKDFVLEDAFGANLWDIEPLCQVAGVCAGNAVVLDGGRGATIHWDSIPRIKYERRETAKRTAITYAFRSGPVPMLIGAALVGIRQSSTETGLGAILLIIGIVLMLASPWSVMAIYGGKVWNTAHHLIAFEGVLPIREIERITFGNSIGRLSYAPASSLLSEKAESERVGKEPGWIADGRSFPPRLPVGHRVFTLLDTGHMSVTVFTAEKPPSVALVAGREGGMLRVILCSYERSTASLHRETVLRLETPMLDRAALLGWVKVEF